MNEQSAVIICRAVKTGITPGAQTGFECSICSEPIALTEGGLRTRERYPNSELICNDCGIVYVQMAEAQDAIGRLEMSPEAKKQLDKGNKSPLAQWMRRRA